MQRDPSSQNKHIAESISASKRNILHRITTHFVSSFLLSGICVAHTHTHTHTYARARAHAHTHAQHHRNHSEHKSRVHRRSLHSMLMLLMSSTLLIVRFPSQCHAVGYSYARFVGPVRGPEREISVYDAINGGSRIDYVAHPEYQFAYGVEDSDTQVLQNRKETRNGDEVHGVYSVVDPDGTLRVVKYTADNLNGFQAEVITNGITTIHGQNGDGDGDGDDGATVKDNGNNNVHNNVYEVHHQHDESSDDDSDGDGDDDDVSDDGNSENQSKSNNDDGGGGGGGGANVYHDTKDYGDGDGDDDDENYDQIEEYEETHSEEASKGDVYSDENEDDDY